MEHTTNRTEYNSQTGDTPSEIRALSPEPRMALYGVRVVFGPQDINKPTEAEFVDYNNKVHEYISGIAFLLTYLGDQSGERPGAIKIINLKKMTPLQMWRAAQTLGEEMAEWEKHLEKQKTEHEMQKSIASKGVQPQLQQPRTI